MFCTKCGQQFEGNFCPNCGTKAGPLNSSSDTYQNPYSRSANLQRTKGGWRSPDKSEEPNIQTYEREEEGENRISWEQIFFICAVIIFAASVLFVIQKNKSEPLPAAVSSPKVYSSISSQPSDFPSVSEAAPIVFETELTCGNYIAGIDFPAGTYNFLAVSGNGNVISDNAFSGGVNTIMGVSGSINGYDVTYENVKLPENVTLCIGGNLKLQIHSDEASGEPLLGRGQDFMDSFDLANGTFVSGRDFKEGTYDIICIEGFGNVHSDNIYDYGINEVMGFERPGYIQRADNIELPAGTSLTLNGITVTMSPSE